MKLLCKRFVFLLIFHFLFALLEGLLQLIGTIFSFALWFLLTGGVLNSWCYIKGLLSLLFLHVIICFNCPGSPLCKAGHGQFCVETKLNCYWTWFYWLYKNRSLVEIVIIENYFEQFLLKSETLSFHLTCHISSSCDGTNILHCDRTDYRIVVHVGFVCGLQKLNWKISQHLCWMVKLVAWILEKFIIYIIFCYWNEWFPLPLVLMACSSWSLQSLLWLMAFVSRCCSENIHFVNSVDEFRYNIKEKNKQVFLPIFNIEFFL